jgi:hypothetical protein
MVSINTRVFARKLVIERLDLILVIKRLDLILVIERLEFILDA